MPTNPQPAMKPIAHASRAAVMDQPRFQSGVLSTNYIVDEFPNGFSGVAPTAFQTDVLTAAATYDDNIYALENKPNGDTIFSIVPEIDIQSTWSRNSLSAYVRAQESLYAKYTTENSTQYGAGMMTSSPGSSVASMALKQACFAPHVTMTCDGL